MVIKNRNLFRITRFIIFRLSRLFKFFGGLRTSQKRLLIIKTDAIGDYIVFRNFIEVIKQSEKFRDYKIDLLGNTLWQDVALKYDAAYMYRFYFIKQYELYEAPLKLLKLGWRLFKNNYEVVLQPSSTRLLITDGLAALTAAKQIIGFESNTEGILAKYKTKTDTFYTTKLILPETVHFEFERSKFFFENVLGESLSINSLFIPVEKNDNNGIVIFPGAGIFKRSWRREDFLALIKMLKQHSPQQIYLAGGPGDIQIGNYLEENLPLQSVNNLIGKTTLPQLIELIGSAALVIANETSAIHIAVATKTPSVCILGGGHFERFAPYPAYFENCPVCVYQKMECYYCNWNCIFETAETEPYPCIDKVNLANVWQAVLALL
ncbi:glycosyltransferase family 9 protein [Mucilaginibacter sp. OK098]|uniref:glycosyltransferase family 9 protein n=1 Tax=Mucilaginibacter sp. OK098 TaxID=1855297 RepID=UPI000919187E|nr:glycosyltransferase family 9 protein [Mucilaginibacter sp. OK098]SHN18269.1 ADP-heptose:LPS heptosyltransferase [Mucilaginibacter sp. OK098]